MEIECTQALDEIEPTQTIKEHIQVAYIIIKDIQYPIYSGINTIGRAPTCNIIIEQQVLSREHAVIEINDFDTHFIYDKGSRNRTRLDKVVLKPNIRYQLRNKSKIIFGDIKAKYYILDTFSRKRNESDEELLNLNISDGEDFISFTKPHNDFLKKTNLNDCINPLKKDSFKTNYLENQELNNCFIGNIDDFNDTLSKENVKKSNNEIENKDKINDEEDISFKIKYLSEQEESDDNIEYNITNHEIETINNNVTGEKGLCNEIKYLSDKDKTNDNFDQTSNEIKFKNSNKQINIQPISEDDLLNEKQNQSDNSNNFKILNKTQYDLLDCELTSIEEGIIQVKYSSEEENDGDETDCDDLIQKPPSVKNIKEKTSKNDDEDETDCEDIHEMSTQKPPSVKNIKEKTSKNDDEDETDCEDIHEMLTQKPPSVKNIKEKTSKKDDEDMTDCEDIHEMLTQKPPSVKNIKKKPSKNDDEDETDCEDIHEMLTQKPPSVKNIKKKPSKNDDEDETDCEDIHEMLTQKPLSVKNIKEKTSKKDNEDMTDCEDIHEMSTQKPPSVINIKEKTSKNDDEDETDCEDIHEMLTQKPPSVKNIKEKTSKKDNEDMTDCEDIHEMLTQKPPSVKNIKKKPSKNDDEDETDCEDIHEMLTQKPPSVKNIKEKTSKNDDEDETDCEDIHEMLTQKPPSVKNIKEKTSKKDNEDMTDCEDIHEMLTQKPPSVKNIKKKPSKNDDEDETDCEDIHEMLTQKPPSVKNIKEKTSKNDDEDETDCEDIHEMLTQKPPSVKNIKEKTSKNDDEDETDCEDIHEMLTQKPPSVKNIKGKASKNDDEDMTDCEDIHEMLTQKPPSVKNIKKKPSKNDDEDETDCEDIHEMSTPKPPSLKNIKAKTSMKDYEDMTDCEDIHEMLTQKPPSVKNIKKKPSKNDDEDMTDCEDIHEMLTQKPPSVKNINEKTSKNDDKFRPQQHLNLPNKTINVTNTIYGNSSTEDLIIEGKDIHFAEDIIYDNSIEIPSDISKSSLIKNYEKFHNDKPSKSVKNPINKKEHLFKKPSQITYDSLKSETISKLIKSPKLKNINKPGQSNLFKKKKIMGNNSENDGIHFNGTQSAHGEESILKYNKNNTSINESFNKDILEATHSASVDNKQIQHQTKDLVNNIQLNESLDSSDIHFTETQPSTAELGKIQDHLININDDSFNKDDEFYCAPTQQMNEEFQEVLNKRNTTFQNSTPKRKLLPESLIQTFLSTDHKCPKELRPELSNLTNDIFIPNTFENNEQDEQDNINENQMRTRTRAKKINKDLNNSDTKTASIANSKPKRTLRNKLKINQEDKEGNDNLVSKQIKNKSKCNKEEKKNNNKDSLDSRQINNNKKRKSDEIIQQPETSKVKKNKQEIEQPLIKKNKLLIEDLKKDKKKLTKNNIINEQEKKDEIEQPKYSTRRNKQLSKLETNQITDDNSKKTIRKNLRSAKHNDINFNEQKKNVELKKSTKRSTSVSSNETIDSKQLIKKSTRNKSDNIIEENVVETNKRIIKKTKKLIESEIMNDNKLLIKKSTRSLKTSTNNNNSVHSTSTNSSMTTRKSSRMLSNQEKETNENNNKKTPKLKEKKINLSYLEEIDNKRKTESIIQSNKKMKKQSDDNILKDKQSMSLLSITSRSSKSTSKLTSSSSSSVSSLPSETTSFPIRKNKITKDLKELSKKILFAGVADIRLENYLKSLGGEKVDTPFDCDILVTKRIRRTFKFLCALARGIPIVSIEWLLHSYEKNYFSDFTMPKKNNDQNLDDIIYFIHRSLLVYSHTGANALERGEDKIPLILGGDFNVNFGSDDSLPLINFLRETFGLLINNDPKESTTKSGTTIDAVFTRYIENIESRTYISYFSYHKPLISVLPIEAPTDNSTDPWSFILYDKDYETRNNCSLRKTLEQGSKKKLLNAYTLFVTPNVKPPPEELKDIIECSGGKFCFQITKDFIKSKHLIISSWEDKSMWDKFKNLGPIYTTELILNGLFKQELELNAHILSK